MIDTIVFDLGGVVFNPNWKKINKQFAKKFGFAPILPNEEEEKIYREKLNLGRISVQRYFSIIKKIHKKKIISTNDIISAYKKYYKLFTPFNKDIINLLKKLRKKYVLVAISDTNPVHASAHIERNLFSHFHKRLFSFKTRFLKKGENSFKKILRFLGKSAKECLFVDDADINIKAAKGAGIKSIKFRTYRQLLKDLKKLNIM